VGGEIVLVVFSSSNTCEISKRQVVGLVKPMHDFHPQDPRTVHDGMDTTCLLSSVIVTVYMHLKFP